MNLWRDMRAALDDLAAADLLRSPAVLSSACGPKVDVGGRQVVCLCSNDYLSLAGDRAIRAAAVEAIARWGLGAGASRLISGTTDLHVELESRLAEFKQAEAALVTPTGWMANHAAVGALAGRGDLIVCDKLSHASIVDAARACGARLRTFAHRDVDRCERLLRRHRSGCRRCLIVTDSLFSMDGDLAPLGELADLKDRFDAALLIDEAHATGVLGVHGRGAAELLGVEGRVDAVVGTMSKAMGGLGGFVAGPRVLIDTLRNTARAFLYTTAAPAALCAAGIQALRIIRREPRRRRRLLELAEGLRLRLRGASLSTGSSVSQIIPILIGPAGEALRISRELLAGGFLVPAIRPPTVPRGTSRLRVSLCATHDESDLSRFVEALAALVPRRA